MDDTISLCLWLEDTEKHPYGEKKTATCAQPQAG